MDEEQQQPLIDIVLYEDKEAFLQWKLVLSEFRDNQYLHLRQYYLDFDGNYVPTPKGISLPVTIHSMAALFDGLVQILSENEAIDIILQHINEERLLSGLERKRKRAQKQAK